MMTSTSKLKTNTGILIVAGVVMIIHFSAALLQMYSFW